MKKVLSLFLVSLLVLLSVSAFVVSAEESDYDVLSADFDITLCNDGSAKVTETWVVDFDGSYSRFYKDICNSDLEDDEKFSDIKNLSVAIDGVRCELTDSPDERPENTYYGEQNSSGYTVSCFKASNNVKRTYTISYTLEDIIKCVDDEYNVITYRCIGADFEKSVDKVSVKVVAPNDCTLTLLHSSSGTADESNVEALNISAANSNGMYKIRVRIDGKIAGAVSIESDDISDVKSGSKGSGKSSSSVPFIIILIIGVVLFNGIKILKTSRLKAKVSKNPVQYITEHTAYWKQKFSPIEFCAYFSNDSSLLPECLTYYIHLGYIKYDKESGTISWDEGLQSQFRPLYNTLNAYVELAKKTNAEQPDNSIKLNDLIEAIKSKQLMFPDLRNKIKSSIKLTKAESKQLKNDLRYWECGSEAYVNNKKPLFDDVLSADCDHILLALMTQKALIKAWSANMAKNGTTPSNPFDNYTYYDYDLYSSYIKANSSSINDTCTSCSSCSSCSSCGGGGAD